MRTEIDSLKSDNIADYLGKDVGFYRILDHFTKLYKTKYNKDLKKLVHEQLAPIMDGPLGSLFHGIIQVGYGWAGESDQVGAININLQILISREIQKRKSACWNATNLRQRFV